MRAPLGQFLLLTFLVDITADHVDTAGTLFRLWIAFTDEYPKKVLNVTCQLKSELKYCNYKQLCKPALKIKAADFDLLCSSCRDYCITSKFLKLTWYHFIRTIDIAQRNQGNNPCSPNIRKATFSSTGVTLWCYLALFSVRLWHDLFEVIKDTLITTNGMLKLKSVDEELFTWHNVSKILLQLQRQNQEIKGTINILHKETLSVLAQRNHCILEKLKPAFNSGV